MLWIPLTPAGGGDDEEGQTRQMGRIAVFLPSVWLQVVVTPGQVGVVDLLPLRGPQEHPGLACLLGQAVVDVGDDRESGALRVAEAHIDPVIPGNDKENSLHHSFRKSTVTA